MDKVEKFREYAAQTTGTEGYTRCGKLLLTDGARFAAETLECWWLVDAIGSYQGPKLDYAADGFQVWALTRIEDSPGALLRCGDGNGRALRTQSIPYTDFPRELSPFTLWVEGTGKDAVLLLPEEH